MGWFEDVFGKWVVRIRWWIIFATLFIVFVATSGLRFLTFSDDMRSFFSEDNPQLKALEALEDTYLKNEQVLIAVAPRDSNVFTHEALSAVKEITERTWKIPYSSRVDSVTNFQHTRAEDDNLIVEDLVQDIKSRKILLLLHKQFQGVFAWHRQKK